MSIGTKSIYGLFHYFLLCFIYVHFEIASVISFCLGDVLFKWGEQATRANWNSWAIINSSSLNGFLSGI